MSSQLPLDELSLVCARLTGLLLTEEKVDRAVQLLKQVSAELVQAASADGKPGEE